MNRIKVLPTHVAHQIAAGEVVERPLSIVKELVENSIDSNATKIDIYIEKGGVSQIKVVDNGDGILKDDLPIALAQHATSKILNTEDLYSISSLGFRGEALASIASVAKIKITSQAKNSDCAYSVDNSLNIEPAAHPKGTSICVNDLFYSIPVRRKFLKTENTEYLNIEQMFNRLAFSHFDIHFRLFKDGKLVKNLPKADDRAAQDKRLRDICGLEMLENCSYISVEQNGITLSGWLGLPTYDRPQGDRQFFYLNSRSIKDKVVMHAIRQAFLNHDPSLRYPAYCLYMNIDSSSVDINVHPTKNEVRFRDPRVVHNFITDVIDEYIEHSSSGAQELDYEEQNENEKDGFFPDTRSAASNINNIGSYKPSRDISAVSNYNDVISYKVDDSISLNDSMHETDSMLMATPKIVCVRVSSGIQLVHIERVWKNHITVCGLKEIKSNKKLFEHRLLEPYELSVDSSFAEKMEDIPMIFSLLGFSIDRLSDTSILIRSVPKILQGYDWSLSDKAFGVICNNDTNWQSDDLEVIFKKFVGSLEVPGLSLGEVADLVSSAGNTNSRVLTEKDLLRLL